MREYKKYRGLIAFVAIAFGMPGYCEICRKVPFITSFADKTVKSRSKCIEFVKFNDVKRRFMSELYIFVYELCALINENLKKNFYFQAGLFLVVVFLGFLAFWLQD